MYKFSSPTTIVMAYPGKAQKTTYATVKQGVEQVYVKGVEQGQSKGDKAALSATTNLEYVVPAVLKPISNLSS